MRSLYLSILIFCTCAIIPNTTIAQVYADQAPNTQQKNAQNMQSQEIDGLWTKTQKAYTVDDFEKTIEYGEAALNSSEKTAYYKHYFKIAHVLGASYLSLEDTTRAKKIYLRAIDKAGEIKNPNAQIAANIDGANYYAAQDKISAKQKALDIYLETIALADSIKAQDALLVSHLNTTSLYIDLKELDEARTYATRGKGFVTNETQPAYVAKERLNRAKLDFLMNRPESALFALTEGEKLFKQLNDVASLIEVYYFKALSYKAINQFDDAYRSMHVLDSLKNIKYEEDKIITVETVTAKFELADVKKELEQQTILSAIKEEQAKREVTYFWVKIAAGILLIASCFLLFSYLRRRSLVVHLTEKNRQFLEEKKKSEKLSKAKSTLFSNITHELRTPMYGIIGISDILLADNKLTHHKQNVSSLKFSADYLLSLVNNILHFNKFDDQNVIESKPVHSVFDLRELVSSIIESSKYLSEDHPNTYHLNIDDDIPKRIKGNQTTLSQVLNNLIANATKFTNNGNVYITIKKTNVNEKTLSLAVEIKDDGIGIANEKQKQIFDEYAQTGEGENFMGTGLGLPIVKKLLEHENAQLHLKSNLSQGTTVSFTMKFEFVAILQAQQMIINSKSLKGKKILIVDDNKINLIVTSKFVEKLGAISTTINNGYDAVELHATQNFDLILMDINMPQMDGFETTSRIRKNDTNVPVVALTAVEKEKVVGQNKFYLMNDIIIKPFNEAHFAQILATHIK